MSSNSSPFAARQGLDDQVVQRLTQGDAEARRAIVEGTSATLYRRALRLAADPSRAKAWLQLTYREGISALASGAPLTDGAEAFLTRVLLERAAQTLQSGEPESPDATGPTPSPALQDLNTWLADLTAPQRLVLVMRELEALPEPEAAPLLAFLGVPVEETLSAALQALRPRAGEEGEEGLTRALDNFRVATATPMRPKTDELVPPAESLPPPAPPRDTGQQLALGGTAPAPVENGFGGVLAPVEPEAKPSLEEAEERGKEDDELAAAFDDALSAPGTPKRTRSSGEVPAVPKPEEEVHDWYLGVDEEQLGPMKKSGVRELWRQGRVGPDSLAWREGLPDWLALSRIVEFMDVMSEPTTDAPPHPPLPSKASPLALSALVQQELSAITATAVTEPPKKVPPVASQPVRRTQSLLGLSTPSPAPASAPTPTSEAASAAPTPAPSAPSLETPSLGDSQVTQQAPHAPEPEPLEVPTPRMSVPVRPRGWFLPAALGLALLDVLLTLVVCFADLRRPSIVYVQPPAPVVIAPPTPPAAPPPATVTPPSLPSTPAEPSPAVTSASESPPAVPTSEPSSATSSSTKTPPSKPATKVVSPVAPAPASTAGQTKVATVGNRAQNDRDFDKLFKSDKPAPAPAPPPAKHEVYVPPAPGSAKVPPRLTTADMMSTVLEHKPAIEACARAQGRQQPNLHGTLVMKFTIAPSGKVSSVAPVTDAFKKTTLAKCLGKEIPRWKFLKHQEQGEPVKFPFKF